MSRQVGGAGQSWLLRGGTLVTMDAGRRVVGGDLLIRDGRIAAVGEAVEAADSAQRSGAPFVDSAQRSGAPFVDSAQRSGAPFIEVLDVSGCIVLPGLVQAHVHLCQTLCRGYADDLPLLEWLRQRVWPYEAVLGRDEAALAVAAQLGCAELLLSGTTAILDMGTVYGQDALCAAVAATGLRATLGKAMMDQSLLGDGVPAGLRETTAESLRASDDLCQRWHGAADGRLRYAYAPRFVLSCTDGLLREVAERVAASGPGGPRLHTHAAEQPDEVALVRAQHGGAGNIAALEALGVRGERTVLAHCVHLDPDELPRLARDGTHVAHCPSSNLKLGSGVAPVVEYLRAGVNVALGADGAPCNNNLDGFAELRLASLLQKGRRGPQALPAAQVLELATLGGARALGLVGEIGALAVGQRADVVVVDPRKVHVAPATDPVSVLAYAARGTDVRHVLVDGRLLVRDRALTALTGLDVESLRAAAHEHGARVLRRAGLL